ncbi:MAG: TQO small subunit DoxD [Vulcanimicrobiaceae bacterium]
MKFPSSKTYAFWLALLRIFTGAAWIVHGTGKFTQSAMFMPPNGFIVGFIAKAASATTGPYHDFLVNVVQPNISIFAELVRLGEVLTGCALVLGIFTRFGGFVGVLLTLNYMAAKGAFGSLEGVAGIDAAMLALSAVNLVLPTGRMLGVDALLGRPRAAARVVVTPAPINVTPVQPVQAEFVDEQPLEGPSAPKE